MSAHECLAPDLTIVAVVFAANSETRTTSSAWFERRRGIAIGSIATTSKFTFEVGFTLSRRVSIDQMKKDGVIRLSSLSRVTSDRASERVCADDVLPGVHWCARAHARVTRHAASSQASRGRSRRHVYRSFRDEIGLLQRKHDISAVCLPRRGVCPSGHAFPRVRGIKAPDSVHRRPRPHERPRKRKGHDHVRIRAEQE